MSDKKNKFYWDTTRNYPYESTSTLNLDGGSTEVTVEPTKEQMEELRKVEMSVPEGLEFGKPYALQDLAEKNVDGQPYLNRKDYPVYTGVLKYFPDALMELSRVSLQGNKQHHPDKPLHWDRRKSTDHLDALARHLIEAEKADDDGILHLAKVAWRALAALQEKLEK
jgi:hypothetical protein